MSTFPKLRGIVELWRKIDGTCDTDDYYLEKQSKADAESTPNYRVISASSVGKIKFIR